MKKILRPPNPVSLRSFMTFFRRFHVLSRRPIGRLSLVRAAVGAGCLVGGMVQDGHAAPVVDFNAEIRPILTKHCTACHGGVKAAGGVSFVYREKAMAPAKSGEVPVVAGKPDESEMLRRISSTDPEEVMPQPEHGPPLRAAEIARIRQWIAEGAIWKEHWSLVPPVDPGLPVVADPSWARQPLDHFVKARLELQGWKPSAEAGPAEWLRRVTLDLTGLPPQPEAYEAFVADTAAHPQKAKEAVVDRLLASPAFGEHWAAHWMDLARYADTYGYEKDPERSVWPWRDWVIQAMNTDLPFDQFTLQQLAGDLLPNPTGNDILATAFHRNTQNNTEGGTNDEEFRTVAVVDRVNTTFTTWQATTFGCVQCHAHPYDPYPHEEYYRFMSILDNTEDTDLDDDFPRFPVSKNAPEKDLLARMWREWEDLRHLHNAEAAQLSASAEWKPLVPSAAVSTGGQLQVAADGRVMATGTLPVGVEYTLTLPATPGLTAVRLHLDPDDPDPTKWPERASVLSHVSLQAGTAGAGGRELKIREVVADYLAGPFDPRDSLDANPGGFGSYPSQSGPRWCVLVLEQPLEVGHDELLILKLKQSAVSNAHQQACTLRNFRLEGSTVPSWHSLFQNPDRLVRESRIKDLQTQLKDRASVRVPVMAERTAKGTRSTRIWTRGNRLTPGAEVQPGVPAVLNAGNQTGTRTGTGADTPPQRYSRLEMARWLTGDTNPLTARVLANRWWAALFGQGIVTTLEDFGSSGAVPSHPELLDHLALRLKGTHGWSLKKFVREIALSATYGQTCRVSAEVVARDPANANLGRGPRQRLSAEMVRDHGLAVSGLLSDKMYGPPVFPPQPEGVWNSVYNGMTWKTSTGEDRFRRGIYTFVKRTSGYPGFLAFDAPARDLCSARRVSTNTPLQALVTLNDPAFLEMAAALAESVRKDGGSVEVQIVRACRKLTLELPPDRMVQSLLQLYNNVLAEYRLVASGQSAAPPEMQAMILVMNTLLNTDFALNR